MRHFLVIFALALIAWAHSQRVHSKNSLFNLSSIESSFQKAWDIIPYEEKAEILKSIKDFIDKITDEPQTKPESFNMSTCQSCKTVSEALYTGSEVAQPEILNFIVGICEKFTFQGNPICSNSIATMGPLYVTAIETKLFEPHFMCNRYLKVCPDNSTRLEVSDFFKEILKDKPARKEKKPTGRNNYTVLHITDTHFNPEYQYRSEADCDLPTGCCQADSSNSTTIKSYAGYWGTVANCDIPLRTVDKFFEWAQKTLKPDIIFFTGDNIDHNIFKQQRSTQALPTIAIAQRIRDYFPDALVFPGIGNHECYPVGMCDLSPGGLSWLSGELKTAFSWFLPSEQINTFEEHLFYSRDVPQYNLKVIMLNTEVFDLYSSYTFVKPTDPGGFLEWLVKELDDCEKSNKTAILVGHYPTGTTSSIYSTTIRFRAVVDRYFNTISGLYFAHVHKNTMQFMPDTYETGEFIGVEIIAPSLTTFSFLNPSVNYYTMDADTNIMVEMTTYSLNLTHWNQFPYPEAPVSFDISHNLTADYNLTDLSLNSLLKIAKGLNESDFPTMATFEYNKFGGALEYPKSINPVVRVMQQCGSLDNVMNQIACDPVGYLGSPTGLLFYIWNKLDNFWFNSTEKA